MLFGKGSCNPIITDMDILNETYIPAIVPSRDGEISDIAFSLKPATLNRKPMHVWIYGEPGVGKTLTANYILKELERACVDSIYVNCWDYSTLYAIVDRLIRVRISKDIRLFNTDAHNTLIKLEMFRKHIKKESFIVVLDEIDTLSIKERNRIIYSLSELGNVGLVCVGNKSTIYYGLDGRARSRLDPRLMEFKRYSSRDLTEILKQRAVLALAPDTWDIPTLENIAELANGDARIAIHTLKRSAEYAEGDGASKITGEHVKKGYNLAKNLKKSYMLYKMGQHYRILYRLIKDNPDILSADLWETYLRKCEKMRMKPVAKRTYFAHVDKLMKIELVRSEWVGSSRGRMRSFRVA